MIEGLCTDIKEEIAGLGGPVDPSINYGRGDDKNQSYFIEGSYSAQKGKGLVLSPFKKSMQLIN